MPNSEIDPELNWNALQSALLTAQTVVKQWSTQGLLTEDEAAKIVNELQARHASSSQPPRNNARFTRLKGFLPVQSVETAGIRGYRTGVLLNELLRDLRSRGQLSLGQYHALQADSEERLKVVRRSLFKEGIHNSDLDAQLVVPTRTSSSSPDADTAGNEPTAARRKSPEETPVAAAPVLPAVPRRSIMEIVLDPRSIQCLLGLGGALIVVGLVILLWINNYFTPPVMAVVLALSNIVLLGVGLATMRFSRYQLAGKALSLLSCLVMPLNLWYCHSNNLITIDGHLWVCAVLISAIYGLSAVVLKDELFVYVFSAGVTMTGLLILGDLPPSPQKFWAIASPATLLVVLGLVGIHLERAFVTGEGPFTRGKFGMAFFWSGHVQLAAGLLLVLGAQIAGDWMYPYGFQALYAALHATPSPMCGDLRWLALALVAGGLYAYTWSDLVVRKKGIFLHVAAFTLLWAEVLIVQLFDLHLGIDAIISILAVTSLLSHLAQSMPGKQHPLTRSLPAFGLLLGILPVLMGVVVYLDHFGLRAVWVEEPPRWAFVGAMLLTAAACRTGAHVYRKSSANLLMGYFFATGAATMVAAVAAFAAMGMNSWQSHAPIMMLIPIVYLIASRMYAERSPAKPLLWVAHAAAAVMLVSSLASAFQSFEVSSLSAPIHLPLALFFAEAAVFYGLATFFRRQPWCVYLSSLMTCAAFWQLLTHFELGTPAYILAFAVTGLLMLIAYRLSLLEKTVVAPLAEALFQSANAVLSLAFVSSVFYGLSQFLKETSGDVQWRFAGFSIAIMAISGFATLITRHPAGRRWYTVTTIAQAVVTLLAIHRLIDLSPWQQVELFAVLIGLIQLAGGHLGWYREQERQSDLVSMNLLFGALLASVPLAIATWIDRSHDVFYPVNEFGFLLVSVALLATGILFQLKSTTVVGSIMTVLYFLTLMIFVPWSELNAVAIAITVSGGVIFGSGLILAFFRESLQALPERIKQREGVYRVFSWR